MRNKGNGRVTWVGVLLASAALAVLGFVYLQLPTIAPRVLVEWCYYPTGEQVMYSGLRAPVYAGETEVHRKRTWIFPGPEVLEIDRFKSGEIASISTPKREEWLFRAPNPAEEDLLRALQDALQDQVEEEARRDRASQSK